MAYDGKQVPDHLLIKIEQPDDPVSAVCEDDARRRSVAYPTIMWGTPIFGFAEEVGGRWRILRLNADEPQSARDGLASHFRRLFSETPETAEHAAERAEYETTYELLDWEPVDERTVNGRRYRIIRAQPFIRMGPDGPEPPRPTDPDPDPPGQADRSTSQMDGFVIDPTTATGLTDGLVRMEMISASYQPTTVPDDVHADSRQALTTHPNVVLLPVAYTIGQHVGGSWRPRSATTYPTPQAARDAGSFSIADIMPDENTPMEEFMAAYERARAAHRPPRTDDFEMRGVPCRVTRVETFVRVGPDGPEGPRPSDRDPHPPPARHVQELRAQGLMPDPD
ncbi:hypothetical protein GCM10022225_72550 [Plantactinospora mayteni]|uniref:PE-PGRS family protein n=1 Tax=Plantactinospora mayteni TaxID=566021 RepID=A0ABQ4F1C6_9ACTN|nr:DUF5954 family protein [Plantactinospora mayteni]GIH00710.1 hypothetical protein Pma05_72820 [Plantactinospora mayteni]